MSIVIVGGRRLEATVRKRMMDPDWNGRQSAEVTAQLTSGEAAELFVHDADWSVERDYTDMDGKTVTHETDMSAYSVAGKITDNRDGTITAKMGLLTEREALEIIMKGDT